MDFERGVGMPRNQEVILNPKDRKIGDLGGVHIRLLPRRGNQIDPCESKSERSRDACSDDREPTASLYRHHEGDCRKQVTSHDADGNIRQPCAGDRQRQRDRTAIERAEPIGRVGFAITQGKQQKQRNPEAAGKLGKRSAGVCRVKGVSAQDRDTSGQCRLRLRQSFPGERAGRKACRGKQHKHHHCRHQLPRQHEPKSGPKHPRQRRVEEKTRLTGPVVCAGRPVRIGDPVLPRLLRIEPGQQVELEVVSGCQPV